MCPQELAVAYKSDSRTIVKVEKPPFNYYVMARCADSSNKDCRCPSKVDATEAVMLVDMLTLLPRRGEVDVFLVAHGFIVNGHFSFTKLSKLYGRYHVARVDTRAISACKVDAVLWHGSVICMIPCDASFNNSAAMGCEACVAARWLSGDKCADPSAAPIASAQAVDGHAGAPQKLVLGSARQSEESAEQGGSASASKRTQRQLEADAAKRAKMTGHSPERDPLAEADASVAADCLKQLSV